MLKDAISLGEIARALVIVLRHHGDVLLASPVLSVLKGHAPRIEVDALVYVLRAGLFRTDVSNEIHLDPFTAGVGNTNLPPSRVWRGLRTRARRCCSSGSAR